MPLSSDTYTKSLQIDVVLNDKDAQSKLEEFAKNIKETYANLKEAGYIEEGKKDEKKPSYLSQQFKGFKDTLLDNIKKPFQDLGVTLAKNFTDLFKKAIEEIVKFAKNMFEETGEYDMQNSLKYNSEAWSNMVNYGLTGSQSYAYSKAMGYLNIGSEEELINYLSLGTKQQEMWQRMINIYESQYEDYAELGDAYNEFLIEWDLFKMELSKSLLDLLIQNKDVIKDFLYLGVDAMKAIVGFFGGSSYNSYGLTDTFGSTNSSSVSSTSNKVTINVNTSEAARTALETILGAGNLSQLSASLD